MVVFQEFSSPDFQLQMFYDQKAIHHEEPIKNPRTLPLPIPLSPYTPLSLYPSLPPSFSLLSEDMRKCACVYGSVYPQMGVCESVQECMGVCMHIYRRITKTINNSCFEPRFWQKKCETYWEIWKASHLCSSSGESVFHNTNEILWKGTIFTEVIDKCTHLNFRSFGVSVACIRSHNSFCMNSILME